MLNSDVSMGFSGDSKKRISHTPSAGFSAVPEIIVVNVLNPV